MIAEPGVPRNATYPAHAYSQPLCCFFRKMDLGWPGKHHHLQHEHHGSRNIHDKMFEQTDEGVHCSRQLVHPKSWEYWAQEVTKELPK